MRDSRGDDSCGFYVSVPNVGAFAFALCVLLWSGGSANAQVPPLPPSTDARPLQRPPPEPAEVQTSAVPAGGTAAPMAPPNADSIRFVLRGLRVYGASPTVEERLLRPYRGQLNTEISLATVYVIANEMTREFRKGGKFLSIVIVPEQQIVNGQVGLRLYEGKIARVEVRGSGVDRRGLSTKIASQLVSDSPVSAPTVERQLLLIGDLPGMNARGTLVPSAQGIGFADLLVDTDQPRVHGDAAADNRNSKYLGQERYTAHLALNSILGLQDATEFEYSTAVPTDRFHTWTVEHSERLTASGLAVNVSYTDYRSAPDLGADFAAFNLETDSKTAFADLTYPVIRSRRTNLSVRVGVRYHDGLTDTEFVGTATRDRIAQTLVGITFDQVDGWRGVNTLDLEVDKGMKALGASSDDAANLSRPGGNPDAAKGTLYLARLQDLGGRFSLLLAVTGQYAASRLLLPDEFAFGGEYFGRAYDAAEIIGDSGAAAKSELRYTVSAANGISLLPYAFYEAGWVTRRVLPIDAIPSSDSALSAGGGLRLTGGAHISGYAEVAKPINHVVAAEGNRDVRIFAGVKSAF